MLNYVISNKMNNKTKILISIWTFGIFLLPFDALPVLPFDYKPICPVIFVIPFVLYLVNILKCKLINKNILTLTIFLVFNIGASFIFSCVKYNNNYSGSVKFLITILLGYITFVGSNYVFSLVKNHCEEEPYIQWFFALIIKAYLFAIGVGVIQLLCSIHVLPSSIRNVFCIFSKFNGNRINLTTSEPSWATMHLLFILPALYYYRSKQKCKIILYMCIVLFIFTFSFQGIVILLIAFLLYLIVQNWRNIWKNIVKTVIVGIAFALLLFSIENLFPKDNYLVQRINRVVQINSIEAFNMISDNDNSTFVRIMYPYLGLVVFTEHPLMGVGGGNFKYEFNRVINKYFSFATNYPEVANDMFTVSGDPRNLYSRILAENGLAGFILFLAFLIPISLKVKRVNYKSSRKIVTFWMILVIIVMLQFGSFAFAHFWLCLAFVNNL